MHKLNEAQYEVSFKGQPKIIHPIKNNRLTYKHTIDYKNQ